MATKLGAAFKSATDEHTSRRADWRTAVIVVGAGRSGTSVLTAGIGALGVDLGDQLKVGRVKKTPKGFIYAEEFTTEDLHHHRHDPSELREREGLNSLTVDAYLWLHRLATDDIGADDPALWSALDDLQHRFEAMAPVLLYADFLEDELKRRFFRLAGFWHLLKPRFGLGGKKRASQAG